MTYRHPKVQRLRRLVSRRSAREAERAFVVEGSNVLGEALASGAAVESVYVDRAAAGPRAAEIIDVALGRGIRVYDLASGVVARIADTVTPQGALAVLPYVDVPLDALSGAAFVVVCAGVRDPGNAGTVLRSAQAAGAEGVVFCHGSVDIFNPKTVRASAGAVFRVPVVAAGQAADALRALGGWGLRRIAAVAHGGLDYTAVDLTGPVALVLGNEARGLDPGVAAATDLAVSIPMAPSAQSLNVGMAAAVLAFEAARQRRGQAAAGGDRPAAAVARR